MLLPVESYKKVLLKERVEKYCCGLPYELRDYCTKSEVRNMTQLVEVANIAYNLMQSRVSRFKGSFTWDFKRAAKEDYNRPAKDFDSKPRGEGFKEISDQQGLLQVDVGMILYQAQERGERSTL